MIFELMYEEPSLKMIFGKRWYWRKFENVRVDR